VIVTVPGSLSSVPSLTTSATTKVPGRSTRKEGASAAASEKAAALNSGREANDHE
jgi:hypothetical protein